VIIVYSATILLIILSIDPSSMIHSMPSIYEISIIIYITHFIILNVNLFIYSIIFLLSIQVIIYLQIANISIHLSINSIILQHQIRLMHLIVSFINY